MSVAGTIVRVETLDRFGLDAIDVRVFGRNLHTWTKYSGIDPETTLFGASVGQQGFDYFGTPQARSFGITLTFHR